jgi:folate-dependent phosphoribosylglycinamide formyltransferase PurN
MRASGEGKLEAEVCVVISNRKTPGVFEKVQSCNEAYGTTIATRYISSKDFPPEASESWQPGQQTHAEEQAILQTLQDYSVDVVLLLGYMKLVGPRIVDVYGYKKSYSSPYLARMINTHPGILPATKGFFGIHVQKHALKANIPTGHCIFAVDAEYDGGPIIAEHLVPAEKGDTAETVFERVQVSERATIAADIANFLRKKDEITKGATDEK